MVSILTTLGNTSSFELDVVFAAVDTHVAELEQFMKYIYGICTR